MRLFNGVIALRIGIALASWSAVTASAQESTLSYEYGTTEELAGVDAVFIDCGSQMDERARIIEVVSKRVTGLRFVSRPEDATIILTFGVDVTSVLTGWSSHSTSTVSRGVVSTSTTGGPAYTPIEHGEGYVFRLAEDGRIRLLMAFTKERVPGLGRRPSTGFARRFAEAYLSANPNADVEDEKRKPKGKEH